MEWRPIVDSGREEGSGKPNGLSKRIDWSLKGMEALVARGCWTIISITE
jgi:hypothetical protein